MTPAAGAARREQTAPTPENYLASRQAAIGSVTARFLGTTTLILSDGRNTVMIDALLTHPRLRTVLLGKLRSDPTQVAAALDRAEARHVDLLLVSHSHYDHVLDAPAVASRTGAIIAGSESTRQVSLGGGISDSSIRIIRDGDRLNAGAFHVRVFRSLHSPGDRVPGTITAPLTQPARTSAYKEGGTFSFLIEHDGLRILIHASANVLPGMYKGVRADVVYLAIGGLAGQTDAAVQSYWHEVVTQTGAQLVVPIHWDDFLRPLDQPQKMLPRLMDNIPKTLATIDALADREHRAIRYMPVIDPVDLQAAVAGEARQSRSKRQG